MKANDGESGLGNQRASERTAAAITTETWPYTTALPPLHFKTTSRGGIVFHWTEAAGKRLQKGLFMGSKGEAAQNVTYHEIMRWEWLRE